MDDNTQNKVTSTDLRNATAYIGKKEVWLKGSDGDMYALTNIEYSITDGCFYITSEDSFSKITDK